MGGSVIKEQVIIENDKVHFKGQILVWETCLWRLVVKFEVKYQRKGDYTERFYRGRYENIDRSLDFVGIATANVPRNERHFIKSLCELTLISAIDPSYLTGSEIDETLAENQLVDIIA